MQSSLSPSAALLSGLVGALALTGVHEAARHTIPHAPRMDAIGMRALFRTLAAAGRRPPRGRRLFRATLLGDLGANTFYYTLVALGGRRGAWHRGAALGVAAGVGALVVPPFVGLGRQPNERREVTPWLTVAWYTVGGLAAAAATRALAGRTGA